MDDLALVTPTYRGDLDVCERLVTSVRAHAPARTPHQLIVLPQDQALFESWQGVQVQSARRLLPRRIVLTPFLASASRRVNGAPEIVAINVRRPFPPIRGWILQQVMKIDAGANSGARVVLLTDSDVEFVRSFDSSSFRCGDVTTLYRRDRAIDVSMGEHVRWHEVARRLLGLPAGTAPYHDYVSAMIAWDPAVVRAMITHLEGVHRRPWQHIIGRELHFSEWTLYGVFADEVLGWRDDPQRHRSSSRCLEWWGKSALTSAQVPRFAQSLGDDDVAVMISAKSGTSMQVRQEVHDYLLSPWRATT